MAKKLNLNKSVYDLVTLYPELIEIMADVGFHEISNKAMLNSVGRIMTIPKGAKMKKIPMERVLGSLREKGFEVDEKFDQARAYEKPIDSADGRLLKLKGYLQRLSQGEDLDLVRQDFVQNFKDVEAAEIMKAEQELIKEGTPLGEVQKLCDIHSALFHGKTKEEQLLKAEKEVMASVNRLNGKNITSPEEGPGHPINTLRQENKGLELLIVRIKEALKKKEDLSDLLVKLKDLSVHYAKKGDLLYPHLKVKYGITGPSDVMWTVDIEIRDALNHLAKKKIADDSYYNQVSQLVNRAEEMIYKENNILYPICLRHFTQEEWYSIYEDSKDYPSIFNLTEVPWPEGEEALARNKKDPFKQGKKGEIYMPGGHLTLDQLTALLNTIPMEISFVDDDNINRYFNEGPKVFKRPGMAIDRDVFSCHPAKVEPMVRSIIESFREGRKDTVPVWMEKKGKLMLVQYMAVRDKDNTYLGTMELVQDMDFAKKYILEEKRPK